MIEVLRRLLGRHWRAQTLLLLLTILGIALGVASVTSIQLLYLSATRASLGAQAALTPKIDLIVRSSLGRFPEAALKTCLETPGVQSAEPLARTFVLFESQRSSQPQPREVFLEVLGLDLLSPNALREDLLPKGPRPEVSPLQASSSPRIFASEAFAKEHGLAQGAPFSVLAGPERISLTLAQAIPNSPGAPPFPSRTTVVDLADFQETFQSLGLLDEIWIRVQDRSQLRELKLQLEAKLPPAFVVQSPAEMTQSTDTLLEAFRLNLTALSLVSVLVGLFLTLSAVQAALSRRRLEYGLLRSLGATQAQVLGALGFEVLLLASLGTGLGLGLGHLAAESQLSTVSGALTELYGLSRAEHLLAPLWVDALGVLVGFSGALLGALLPVWELFQRSPRELMTTGAVLHQEVVPSRALALGALATTVLTLALSASGALDLRALGFLQALVLTLLVPALSPAWIEALAQRVPLQRWGIGLAFRSLKVHLVKSSLAVASMGIAVAMMVGITVMIESFRDTVSAWVNRSVRADLYITTRTWKRAGDRATLDPRFLEALQRDPRIAAVDPLRRHRNHLVQAEKAPHRIVLSCLAGRVIAEVSDSELVSGLPNAIQRTSRGEGFLVSEPLSRKKGIQPGDPVPIQTPQGIQSLPALGVYRDYTTDEGELILSLELAEKLLGPAGIQSVALRLGKDQDAEALGAELRAKVEERGLWVRSNQGLRREIFRIFDQTFAVTGLLKLMSLVVAACSICLTLLVMAEEEASRAALYRALGASPEQIRELYRKKGLALALSGLTLGIGAGLVLAAILIRVVNPAFFGWTIDPSFPVASLALGSGAILVTALGASLYPSILAGKIQLGSLSRDDL